MRYEVLGPLRVTGENGSWSIVTPKPEALLGILLLRADQLVMNEQLIDELWGDKPPSRANAGVQCYISTLRKLFRRHGVPVDPIVTRPSGYLLHLGNDELDLQIFLQRVRAARAYLKERRLEEVCDCLTKALAMWRGPLLGDVHGGPVIQNSVAWLTEVRIECAEMLVDANLGLGRNREVLGQLYELISEHPLRENLYRQLMLALYRSGCRAEALDVYRTARARVRSELGLEPGHELRSLHQLILTADHRPSLVHAVA